MKTIEETALTVYTDAIGSKYLGYLTDSLYGSGTFALIMYLATVFMIVGVGISIARQQPPTKSIFYLLAVLLSTPWNGAPIGFAAVNGISNLIAVNLDKATLQFISDTGDPNTASNLPPGIAMEMIAAAATTEVKSPETRHKLQKFLSKCYADTLRTDGHQAEFNDLFDFRVSYETTNGGLSTMVFNDNVIDSKSLENNDAYSDIRAGWTCKDALDDLRKGLVLELEETPLHLTDRVVQGNASSNDGKLVSTEKWFDNWKRHNSPFLSVSRNLRLAVASQYEKSRIVNEMGGGWNNGYYEATNMSGSLREFMLGLDSNTVDLGFQTTNIKEIGSRVTGNRWAFSLGATLKDLKEKIELAPYYLVTIKNFLKILCVFAILTVFFGKFQIFFTWAGSWFIVTVLPSVMNAIRSQHNAIVLSKLGIQDFISGAENGNKALAYGVDISQARELLDEFIPLAYTMVNQEIQIIGFFSALVLGGSWLAGMMGNGVVGWLSSSVMGQMIGAGTRLGGKVTTALGGTSMALVSSSFTKLKEGMPERLGGGGGWSFSSVFPKEKS